MADMTDIPQADQSPAIDAILYLPGMGEKIVPQPISAIAQRLARGLDLQHPDEHRRYRVESLTPLQYGLEDRRQADGCRIVDGDGTNAQPVCDIYKVDYRRVLFPAKRPAGLMAAFSIIGSLVLFGLRWARAVRKAPKKLSFGKQLQLVIGGCLATLVALGIISLVLAAATTLPWLWLKKLDTQWQNWLANLYAVLVFLGGAQLLTGKRVRAELEDLAWDLSMVGEYLDNEYKREEILSEIDNALEAIAESSTGYRRVILLAYSFGSVVALEATLARADVAPRVRKHVKTLVTIGCPYDFVTTYWPDFFRFSPRLGVEWINAYTEADVLGSRFCRSRKGEQVVVPDIEFEFPEARKVPPKLSRLMSLRGFFVHGLYWSPEYPDQPAVFSRIAREMYLRDSPLPDTEQPE